MGPVPSIEPIHIVLEIDEGEPLTGWIECEGFGRRPFAGLVQLVSRLDEVRNIGRAGGRSWQ
jgi:hypothetical protein